MTRDNHSAWLAVATQFCLLMEKAKVGYLALILDRFSAEVLKSVAKLPKVHCHHCTVAYGVREDELQEYRHLLNQVIKVQGVKLVRSARVQTLVIEGIEVKSDYPHVTISCANGVKPGEALQLLQSGQGNEEEFSCSLQGTVTFVPFPVQPQ